MSLYLYALLDRPPTAELGAGAWGEPLRIVQRGAVAALVGEVAAPPAVDEPGLRGHDAVVRRIAGAAEAVLPARFGSVADEASLDARLREREAELGAALELVRGREQMTLRVFTAAPAPAPSAPMDGGGPGTSWMRARAQAAGLPELAPVRDAVARFVVRERLQRHSTPPLVASLYHLLRRGDSDAYLAALDAAAPRLSPLRAVASGPWPAYAFNGDEP